jgi:hypothetical protein
MTVSQRELHRSADWVELAFERLTSLNLHRATTVCTTVAQEHEGALQ